MFSETPLAHGFEIHMTSELKNVDRSITVLRKFLKRNHADQHLFPLSLLTREALNNAMIHGNGLDPAKLVAFRILMLGGGFRLEVNDEGMGFDWRKHIDTRSRVTQESGRGHEIYHVYASQVRYNEPGTQLILDYSGDRT